MSEPAFASWHTKRVAPLAMQAFTAACVSREEIYNREGERRGRGLMSVLKTSKRPRGRLSIPNIHRFFRTSVVILLAKMNISRCHFGRNISQ